MLPLREQMKDTKRNEAATVIAELFGITPRYVRSIVADYKKQRYKGINPERIRIAYFKYLRGKEALLKKISSTKEAA